LTRRLLINARHTEELRVAVARDSALEAFHIEVAERGLTRGNIYRGTIASIQPSLNAAFIDYGAERHGFLAIQDVVAEAYYHSPADGRRPRIEEVLERGQPIVVQVEKEPEGQKGAAVTTNLSLAGRYLVLTPFDDTRGVSRKVEDEETRRELRAIAGALEVPPGSGVIVRTNALGQNKATLARDLAALLRLWKRIEAAAQRGLVETTHRLLYSDQDLLVRALRDLLDAGIDEVLVDEPEAHARAQEYVRAFMPRSRFELALYADRLPLFARHGLEAQIDRIHDRVVPLPAGGSIAIDRTEALTAVDVNSGRSTRAASHEETALATNLEAAAEVARQLRLRDIGGLVVVDFIDMRSHKSQRQLEKALREAMKSDRARFTVGKLSANGLLEINRQRIQQALHFRTHRACPTCAGTGRIPSAELVSLNLLRRIEARAASGRLRRVRVGLHPELADAFQNLRRHDIEALEREFAIQVEIVASNRLHRTDQEVEWFDLLPGEAPPLPLPAAPPGAPLALMPAAKGEGGRRRHRRGGRKRAARRAGGEAPAAAVDGPAKPPAEGAAPRAKRRRRGGRRKRGGAPAGPGAAPPGPNPPPPGGGEE
jgi:ribonuclease E